MDYVYENSRTIVIPAKAASVSFNITIIDDYILEANESFYLYIDSMVPDSVVKAVPSQVQVMILNDDIDG